MANRLAEDLKQSLWGKLVETTDFLFNGFQNPLARLAPPTQTIEPRVNLDAITSRPQVMRQIAGRTLQELAENATRLAVIQQSPLVGSNPRLAADMAELSFTVKQDLLVLRSLQIDQSLSDQVLAASSNAVDGVRAAAFEAIVNTLGPDKLSEAVLGGTSPDVIVGVALQEIVRQQIQELVRSQGK